MRLVLAFGLAAAVPFAAGTGPAAACMTAPALVLFDTGSAELGPEARRILESAVTSFIGQGGTGRFRLIGHSDRAGGAASNRLLSRRRAEAVRDYLAAHGVPEATMEVAAAGEESPLVATPDGAAEPRNRFVELRLLPGADDAARREAEIRSGQPIPTC
jgi:OmpA-OmpF porin, OOP family